MLVLSPLIMAVAVMVSVALFTLMERKVLGYVHFRLGPNKNLILGLGQPFNDLIKLFSKNDYKHSNEKSFLFGISPLMMVLFSLALWNLFQHWGSSSLLKYGVLIIMIVNGMVTFFFLLPGWASGSTYSMLGSYRSSAQAISYEGIFFFCMIIFVMMFANFNFFNFMSISFFFQNSLTLSLVLFPWVMSILAESNRSPMDFSEGESELVSGFNTEYGSGLFSIIFLSEYMSMLFYSFLTSFIFFSFSGLFLPFFIIMIFLYVWVRTAFPRLRYDKLMKISWKSLMFFSTSLFLVYFCMIMF